MHSTTDRQIASANSSVKVSDNTEMGVYLARPVDAQNAPTLIVLQEAFGVNAHIRDVTDHFAKQGYVAASPELFHRTAPKGFTAPYTDFGQAMPHYQALTVEGLSHDLRATHKFLSEQPGVDAQNSLAIGYCMGGRAAYLANAILPLKGSVSYYGGGIAPDLLGLTKDLHGPQMLAWGGLDKHIGDDQIQAVVQSLKFNHKKYVNVVFSQGDHGFFCDEKPQYDADSSAQAWALTLEFMRNCLARV